MESEYYGYGPKQGQYKGQHAVIKTRTVPKTRRYLRYKDVTKYKTVKKYHPDTTKTETKMVTKYRPNTYETRYCDVVKHKYIPTGKYNPIEYRTTYVKLYKCFAEYCGNYESTVTVIARIAMTLKNWHPHTSTMKKITLNIFASDVVIIADTIAIMVIVPVLNVNA